MSLLHRHAAEVEAKAPALAHSLFGFPSWWPFPDTTIPRIEEIRSDDELVVRFEMPGIDPDNDVEITVSDGTLRIEAERREESKDDDKGYRSEFQYGAYTRSIALPPGTTDDAIKASYKDGILEVHVPVTDERPEAKRIAVSRS